MRTFCLALFHSADCQHLFLLQARKGEVSDVVRVHLQTPTGCCYVDITRALLQRHLEVMLNTDKHTLMHLGQAMLTCCSA